MKESFGQRLKRLRGERGYIKASDFAEKLNISYQAYLTYENRSVFPTRGILCSMADLLEVSVDELVGHKPRHYDIFERVGFKVSSYKKNQLMLMRKALLPNFKGREIYIVDREQVDHLMKSYKSQLHMIKDLTAIQLVDVFLRGVPLENNLTSGTFKDGD